MYRVVKAFADLYDNEYIYNVGDEYPRPGMTVNHDRLEELSSNRNGLGVILIVNENAEERPSVVKEDTLETKTGATTSGTTEGKRKARKRSGEHVRTGS